MGMSSGSWASYQAALPIEARVGGEPDDEPSQPRRLRCEGPSALYVEWFEEFTYPDTAIEYDPATGTYRDVAFANGYRAPVGRWFPAERWAWKHAVAWRDAMTKRHGHATIENVS